MALTLPTDWETVLAPYLDMTTWNVLRAFVEKEYQEQTIYPPQPLVFKALEATPYKQVKVCLLGQDPYHGAGQANGLAFSVAANQKMPPSLRNMYRELHADLGGVERTTRDLSDWAQQGVLLLNTVLTVRAGEANSHRGKGWEMVTDAIIHALNARQEPVIFVLWGNAAQTKRTLIDASRHAVIMAAHPSPLSAYRGFFGSKPYSAINQKLSEWGKEPIQWS